MENTLHSAYERFRLMPHQLFMEKNGISSCDFTAELAKKNEAFLELYLNSLEDGIISDEEENKLIALSIKIRDLLEKYLKV